jgi:hypothetical protein
VTVEFNCHWGEVGEIENTCVSTSRRPEGLRNVAERYGVNSQTILLSNQRDLLLFFGNIGLENQDAEDLATCK